MENFKRTEELPYSINYVFSTRRIKEDSRPIMHCRLIMDRKKSEFSLGIRASQEGFDKESKRFVPIDKDSLYLNNKLDEFENKLKEAYNQLKYTMIGGFTVKEIKAELRGEKERPKPKQSLLAFLDQFIAEIKLRPEEYRPLSVNKYEVLRTHLGRFFELNEISKHLPIDRFTPGLLERFESHLLTWKHPIRKKPMKRESANTNLKRFKALYNQAIRRELVDVSPFRNFKIPTVKSEKVPLTAGEIKAIIEHPLSENQSLIRTRDIFMFSVYTGLRYSDSHTLRSTDVFQDVNGRYWISRTQVKTKLPIHIPMLRQAVEIYHKYEEHRNQTGFVLPQLVNQKVNLSLKEIARLVGIQKWITHHTARHTYASTILLENDVDIKTVSKMLGHGSVKTTEVYAKVSDKHLAGVADRVDGVS